MTKAVISCNQMKQATIIRMLNETRMLVVNCSSQDAQHHTFHIAVRSKAKLQAPVHDILPPSTAVVDYATGLPKLSDNG